jgi:hypothetical protein
MSHNPPCLLTPSANGEFHPRLRCVLRPGRVSPDPWAESAVCCGGGRGAGLGTFAVVGSVLTLGLIQRWGQVFPRWIIGLAGRRVPVMLAVVPALFVAVAVTSASVCLLSNARMYEVVFGADGMAALPMLLWPVWGVALTAAAWAYYVRRRGADETRDQVATAG